MFECENISNVGYKFIGENRLTKRYIYIVITLYNSLKHIATLFEKILEKISK